MAVQMWGTFVVEQKMFISGFKDLKKMQNKTNKKKHSCMWILFFSKKITLLKQGQLNLEAKLHKIPRLNLREYIFKKC